MSKWSQESAMEELNALIQEIPAHARERRFSAAHTRWLARTLRLLEQVFGQASRYYLSFAALTWGESASFIIGGPGDPQGVWDPQTAIERRNHEAYVRELDTAKGLLQAAVDDLDRSGIEAVYEGKDTALESSALVRILTLIERKLRKVMREQPSHEREVQDALEDLLIGADIDYSRETASIEYSSKTYRPDFNMPRIDLIVEVKFCGREGREKEIIAEINDDILAYQTEYGNQIFVVYDLGLIRDVDRFAGTIEENDGVLVRVIKH